MGAKHLKAIAVRGTSGVPIADPERFIEAVQHVWEVAKGGVFGVGQPERGYPFVACSHGCSVRCMTVMQSAPAQITSGTRMRMAKCNNNAFEHGLHPGYQGRSSTGGVLSVPRPKKFGEVGRDLDNLVEDLGLTSWCYGSWYRYLGALCDLGIEEVLGEPVKLDDPGWWRDWVHKVAHRQGTGDEYAEGLARFYQKHGVGPRYVADFVESAGSRGHGWHREGRTLEGHSSPFWEHAALLYAVSTRDVTPSTHGFLFQNRWQRFLGQDNAASESARVIRQFAEQLYGSPDAFLPGNDRVAYVTAWHQYRAIIKDSMGVCDWVYPVLRRNFASREALEDALRTGETPLLGEPGAEATLYRDCTGIDLDILEMERPIAERIVNLERCIDVRNTGRDREIDEAVIPHFQWEGKTDGTHLSSGASEFRAMLDDYYALRGWDAVTGCPSVETLRSLDLGEVAETLHRPAAFKIEGTL
jgi:aldehyde:ferredoxin oxidoreductase